MRRFIKKHIPPFIIILLLFVLALTPSLSHNYVSEVAAITDASGISSNQPASQPTDTLAEQSFAGLPLLFTKNVGQVDSSVSYYVKTTGQTAYLTNKGIIFDLVR
jgi:hypothetical protein